MIPLTAGTSHSSSSRWSTSLQLWEPEEEEEEEKEGEEEEPANKEEKLFSVFHFISLFVCLIGSSFHHSVQLTVVFPSLVTLHGG